MHCRSLWEQLSPATTLHLSVHAQDRDLWVASVGDSRALLLTRPPKSPASLLSKAEVSQPSPPKTPNPPTLNPLNPNPSAP